MRRTYRDLIGALAIILALALVWADVWLGIGDRDEAGHHYPRPDVPAWTIPATLTLLFIVIAARRASTTTIPEGLGPVCILLHLLPIGATWIGYMLYEFYAVAP